MVDVIIYKKNVMFVVKTNRVNNLKLANEDFTAVNRVRNVAQWQTRMKFEIVDYTIFFEKQQVFEYVQNRNLSQRF